MHVSDEEWNGIIGRLQTLESQNAKILNLLEEMMQGLTDLQNNVGAQTTAVAALQTAAAAVQAGAGDSDAAVETLAQQVAANTGVINSVTATLTSAFPPAPAPTPTT